MGHLKNFHKFRYVVCFSAWLSLLALYSQRINLSVAIIGMVQDKKSGKNDTSTCPIRSGNTATAVKNLTEYYDWDESMQNYILLAYNVGYMIGHVPGAFLSVKFGYRNIMVVCIACSTLLTFVSVWVAPYQWIFFVIRSMIGVVNGPVYPMIHETIAGHSPPAERTYLTMLTHTGNLMSLVLILPVGGILIEKYPNGWKYIFYFSGILGLIATILWTALVYSEPDENIWMSDQEKELIISSIYPSGKPVKNTLKNVPYRKIFNSRHLYIFTSAHFAKMCILYMNLFGIVKYLYKFFNLSSVMAANLSVIPFISDFTFQAIYPSISGLMIRANFSSTKIRKINTFIGTLGCSSFLIAASFATCHNLVMAIILMSLSLMFLAPFQAGYFTAIIEYAPQYSGITFSFINVGGSFSGVVQRYLTALMVQSFPDIRIAYKYSFIATGMISFVLSMVYVIFGTAELQPWAISLSTKPESMEIDNNKSKQDDV